MKRPIAILLGLVSCLGVVCQPFSDLPSGEASFQGLGDLAGGESFSAALAVSGDGNVVVGYSKSESGVRAFRWENGTITELNPSLGSTDYYANAVSADGSVIVGTHYYPDVGTVGFLWSADGGMIARGSSSVASPSSDATGVSADGNVVVGHDGYLAAILSAGGSVSILSGLPLDRSSWARGVSADGSVVVGYHMSDVGAVAFRWSAVSGLVDLGHLSSVEGAMDSDAYAVSADGTTVVGRGTSEAGGEAFRWTEATGMVGLGDLPGGWFSSDARAVSADGAVVVGASVVDVNSFDEGNVHHNEPVYEAFIWDQAHGMRRLADVLVDDYGLDLTGWRLGWALGISDDGRTIVGYGTNPAGQTEGWSVRLSASAE
jgi:probable HAF family extracellular repeat protein